MLIAEQPLRRREYRLLMLPCAREVAHGTQRKGQLVLSIERARNARRRASVAWLPALGLDASAQQHKRRVGIRTTQPDEGDSPRLGY